MKQRRVAVIGAGASGLPCIRHALLYGLDVTCFEASSFVGGLWRYRPGDKENSSVMKSTIINTSKEMTAYSDFPPKPETPNFMHNTQMYKYLQDYADHHQLHKHIKFNHKVRNVIRSEDYRKTGEWKVIYVTPEGEEKTEIFDGVCMCSGHHSVPYIPEPWEGQRSFKGKIIHSLQYKDQKGYEDQTVVVVGVGNSGVDVAVELSRAAKQVYLVSRRGTWVFNRVFKYGNPIDMVINRKCWYMMRKLFPEAIFNRLLENMLTDRFDHEKFGLKPQHRVLNAHQTINDELPGRLACGSIRIKPAIEKFSENQVQFVDGSKVGDVDTIILATGYNFEFKLCEDGNLFKVIENEADLFLNMFPLETADHNTLAIIGLIQPFGSIAPVSEMQARVFFENFAGSPCLPSKSEMKNDILVKRNALKSRYIDSRRHTIQIEFIDYMDELAAVIGAKPNVLRLLATDPKLAYKTVFGPRVSSIYRLQGPNPWSGAKQAIESSETRAVQALNPQGKAEGKDWIFQCITAAAIALLGIIITTTVFSFRSWLL